MSGSNLEIPIKDYDFKDKSNLNNYLSLVLDQNIFSLKNLMKVILKLI